LDDESTPAAQEIVVDASNAGWRRRWLNEQIVGVAIPPVLIRLEADDDRMRGRVIVLGRVLPRRLIAATDVAARRAQAQVNPPASRGQALRTTVWSSGLNVTHL
jgi:hypothetical protein